MISLAGRRHLQPVRWADSSLGAERERKVLGAAP